MIKHIDTSKVATVSEQFKSGIKEFSDIKTRVSMVNINLLSSWIGKGRNEYEKEFLLLERSIKDLDEGLYKFYENLLEVESTFRETDELVANEFNKAAIK